MNQKPKKEENQNQTPKKVTKQPSNLITIDDDVEMTSPPSLKTQPDDIIFIKQTEKKTAQQTNNTKQNYEEEDSDDFGTFPKPLIFDEVEPNANAPTLQKPGLQSLGSFLISDHSTSFEDLAEEEENTVVYLNGDASKPKFMDPLSTAIIVVCCDNTGQWPERGFFRSVSSLSQIPQKYYDKAHSMGDLHLGDVHLVPLTELAPDVVGTMYVALAICQSRKGKHGSHNFNMLQLSTCLAKIAQQAKNLEASVHLPRIGADIQGVNYYSIERIIRDTIVGQGIKTYIYYYQRPNRMQKRFGGQATTPTKRPTVASLETYGQTQSFPSQNELMTVGKPSLTKKPSITTNRSFSVNSELLQRAPGILDPSAFHSGPPTSSPNKRKLDSLLESTNKTPKISSPEPQKQSSPLEKSKKRKLESEGAPSPAKKIKISSPDQPEPMEEEPQASSDPIVITNKLIHLFGLGSQFTAAKNLVEQNQGIVAFRVTEDTDYIVVSELGKKTAHLTALLSAFPKIQLITVADLNSAGNH